MLKTNKLTDRKEPSEILKCVKCKQNNPEDIIINDFLTSVDVGRHNCLLI